MSTFMRTSPTQWFTVRCSMCFLCVLFHVSPAARFGARIFAQCVFSVSCFMSLPRLDSVRGFLLNVLVFPLYLLMSLWFWGLISAVHTTCEWFPLLNLGASICGAYHLFSSECMASVRRGPLIEVVHFPNFFFMWFAL
ncbi:uncharacterized protein HD556DRAFT_1308141 [Suillus plorans]|uniref:Uncharacterized protein n=1 Tax=Suillus plorans TaxID=116603 RepID=A0A9P7ASB6_9AGAM|nr:uncharacterized protein HD556DRAFT_1308141 [Suillus plorans]KAG1794444.1 hypothetical protein HD556DRAFT_1308141 [Suillus plorans]